MDYPIWDLAMGGGTLMAIVAIPHVIVSHFAIGGRLLLVVTKRWLRNATIRSRASSRGDHRWFHGVVCFDVTGPRRGRSIV
jgi:hypothetical protein